MNDLEPSDPLTNAQRERFCRLMAKGESSQGQCYATAYGRDEVDDTAYVNASKLLRITKVSARIQTLKEQAARVATLDASYVLSGLMTNAEDARAKKDYASSNRAFELLGKALDIFKDGVVLEDKRERPMPDYSKMTLEELRAAREELLQRDN